MKKLLILAGIVVVAWLAWSAHRSKQAPLETFQRFSDAVARGQYDIAAQHADGDIAGKDAGARWLAVGWVPVQDLRSVRYEVETRESREGGKAVALTVVQTVGFNPPGVESAMRSAMRGSFRQKALVRKTPAGWKVVEFTNEFLGVKDS